MEVVIRRRTDDGTIETTECPEYDSAKEASKDLPAPKVTAFSLYEDFVRAVPCARIDGILHILDSEKQYYRPMDKTTLESFLLRRYYRTISATGSLRIAKNCAELILHHVFAEVSSADKNKIMCFPNGYLSLNNIELLHFYYYDYSRCNPFPTYHIKCGQFPVMASWEMMKMLPTPYMDSFLRTSGCGVPKFEERVWEMLGYLLSPDRDGKCFFLLQGLPNSGKSLLGRLLQELLPSHKIANLDIDQLSKKNATKELANRNINISMDLPNKALSTPAIRNIKLITGGDSLTIEHSNGEFEAYTGNCTFLFASNHPLTLRGSDSGFEERLVCIPFTYTIPPKQRNRYLLNTLLNERDNIVAKALAYYRDLRNNGYVFSGSEYELFQPRIRYLPSEAEDFDVTLCDFVDNRCEFAPKEKGIHTEDLYNAYRSFCKDYNETPIDNIASFSRRLLRCYGDRLEKDKWRKNGEKTPQWGFKGILLQPMSEVKIYNV